MSDLAQALLLAAAAGAMIPLGGLLAHVEHLRSSHFRTDLFKAVLAFGGGALLAAAMLVLIPHGLERASGRVALPAFVLGSAAFLGADRVLERKGTEGGALFSMVMDYVPESVALGVALAVGEAQGVLLAVLIGMQNLPEGFQSYRDLVEHHARARVLMALAALTALGPLAGWAGFSFLKDRPVFVAGVLLFSAGGIVASVFQDIAPHAHRERHIMPTWGALLGFSLGLLGHVLVH